MRAANKHICAVVGTCNFERMHKDDEHCDNTVVRCTYTLGVEDTYIHVLKQ